MSLKFHKSFHNDIIDCIKKSTFHVIGLGSLIIGIWSYISKWAVDDFIPSAYGTLSIVGISISAGLTVIIIVFIGFLSLWLKSRLLFIAVSFLNVVTL